MRKGFFNHPFAVCANDESTHVYPTVQRVYAMEAKEIDGRIINQMVVKTIDRRDEEANNKVSDFCLENQIAVGSVNLQSAVCYGGDAIDSITDAASAAVAKMDAAAAAASKSSSSESSKPSE